jgi:hypothetical protein
MVPTRLIIVIENLNIGYLYKSVNNVLSETFWAFENNEVKIIANKQLNAQFLPRRKRRLFISILQILMPFKKAFAGCARGLKTDETSILAISTFKT